MYFDSEKGDFTGSDVELKIDPEESSGITPRYNVVLLDDNNHTYDYVVEMLMRIFGHSREKSFEMACKVDYVGRVVVFTTHKEEAEVKRNDIISYGPDWRLERSKGSMSALIEKVE